MSDLQLFESETPSMSYAALYLATWQQIQKDFSHFCSVPETLRAPEPNQMLEDIVSMLHLLSSDSAKLNSLFYRIDLSERKKIPHSDIHALAWMILQREAQKVWIRAHYGSPSE